MLTVPEIDSIYFEKDVEITNNQSETQQGIRIYLDSKDGAEENQYFRWAFEETWKFRVPTVPKFVYIDDTLIIPVASNKDYCWKQHGAANE